MFRRACPEGDLQRHSGTYEHYRHDQSIKYDHLPSGTTVSDTLLMYVP